ncbi:decarboxylating NADP(+)-dependent phosphogluconate dehydrogenase [bacterium]|nr:decarboxylating NADP(+)-dependent phosphogluconate dehydrogenase [bacterium]
MAATADFGLIGLGVMGENLVLNVEDKGFCAAVYNRTTEKVDRFINGRGKGKSFIGTHTIEEFVASIKRPRKIMMLVKAGRPVDAVIEQLLPYVEEGDIVIDGGNSYWPDSTRRTKELREKGILFVGTGVSGGEEGALHGPSLMPGGDERAWKEIKPIFQAIAAKVNDKEVACDWVGDEGAGHFVKMVHNGIEYGDIQIICEAYQLMRELLGMDPEEIGEVFAEWNKGELDSYLIEITSHILQRKDDKTGKPMVDLILDAAGQKGTGRWTVIDGMDLGQPITLIAEAVFARNLSAMKETRVRASKHLPAPTISSRPDRAEFIKALADALLASKIVSYAQGYQMIEAAGTEFGWKLNKGGIALMWRAGCIIRSAFLGDIRNAFAEDPQLENLILAPFFRDRILKAEAGWRRVVSTAALNGIPTPSLSSALAYYDGFRSARLPANLLQAMRDYFGAHTYERIDRPRGEFFHTDWVGLGGNTTSSSYNA